MKKQIFTFLLAVLSAGCAVAAPRDSELFEPVEKDPKRCVGILPPGVKTIACIAPGSYPGSKSHKAGLELLRQAGYRVKIMPHTFVRQEDVAQAPLAGRLSDFYRAWNDPEVDMIFCVRGGRGSEQVMDNIDWKKLKHRPGLYFQGYSDITIIVNALLAKGNGHPIAGPMAGGLPGLTADSLDAMRKIHHGKTLGPVKVKTLVPGDCQGLALAGLLRRFVVLTGKDYLPERKGRIIFIEDVRVSPKVIRENLNLLLEKKFFDGAAGVVFCHFIRSGSKKEIAAVLKEIAPKLGVPVYMGYPFGHAPKSYSIDFTRKVVIKNGTVTFPAVK